MVDPWVLVSLAFALSTLCFWRAYEMARRR